MTAYELSEFKIQLLTQKQYLEGELGTDSETVSTKFHINLYNIV